MLGCSGSNLFYTDGIPERNCRKVDFEEKSADDKKHEKLSSRISRYNVIS